VLSITTKSGQKLAACQRLALVFHDRKPNNTFKPIKGQKNRHGKDFTKIMSLVIARNGINDVINEKDINSDIHSISRNSKTLSDLHKVFKISSK